MKERDKKQDKIYDSWLVKTPIAHRGFHDNISPENSLSSFEKAIQKGYAIELDVYVLSDDTVIVFHDTDFIRLAGFNGTMQSVKYEDIKGLYLLNTKERIPTLEEALSLVNGRVPLLIEIKSFSRKKVGKIVWKVLENYKGEVAIQSFNPFILKEFREVAPHIKRGQISCFFRKEKIRFFQKSLLKRMAFNKRISKPDFISYSIENLPNRFVNRCKDLPLLAWVIKTNEEYQKTKSLYDNVIFEGFEIQK